MIKTPVSIYLAIVLLLVQLSGSTAVKAAEFSAGILPTVVFPLADGSNYTLMAVFYPTKVPSVSFQMGPFTVEATPEAPLAKNVRGAVVISHGLGGSTMGHRDIATALAQEGFIVAAILHSKDNYQYKADLNSLKNWLSRPLEVNAAITAIQNHTKFSDALIGRPVGAFGFSRGGYTLLAALGAAPDIQRLREHCAVNTHDPACKRAVASEDHKNAKYIEEPLDEPRICAAVLADPFAAIFNDDALREIRDVPIQVYLPENENELLAQFHGGRLSFLLSTMDRKHPVETVEFPHAQHFSFLAPFPHKIELPDEMRRQYNGFDRDRFTQMFHMRLIKFFKNTMKNCNGNQ